MTDTTWEEIARSLDGRETARHDPVGDVARGWTLLYDAMAADFTDHAVEMANARHFRVLDLEEARRRLVRLAHERGRYHRDPPGWLSFKPQSRAILWLVIDEPEMAFPLYGDGLLGEVPAGTCLTPEQTPVGASVRGIEKLAGMVQPGKIADESLRAAPGPSRRAHGPALPKFGSR